MLRRFYHISVVNYNVRKQGARLCKMLSPKSVKKNWHPTYTEVNTLPSVKSLTKVVHQPGNQGVRRIAVLNKLFMKHITDIMSTGSSSIEIVGRGIEISKVKVSSDLQRVNVFWVCKGSNTDKETESVLSRIAGALRHELSTLRLIGEVPYIVFVKDRQEARLVELDRRLTEADYGEDYTPTELGHLLKTDFTLVTKLSPEMRAKIKRLEDALPVEEEPLPLMTNNVYGLDHDKIMNRLLAARKKNRDAWRNINSEVSDNSNVISYRSPTGQSAPEVDTKKQKQELAEFLQRRQIEQNKLQKAFRANRDWELQPIDIPDDSEPYYWDDEDDYSDEDDNFVCKGPPTSQPWDHRPRQ